MRKLIKPTGRATKRKSVADKTVSQAKKNEAAVTVIRPLTASGLKEILWETLVDLKHENILPNRADAIAAQSREILRTVKTQLQIAGQAKRGLPQEIIDFSEKR